jgi:hypothetical protein
LVSLGIVAEMMINREIVREDPLRHVTERTTRSRGGGPALTPEGAGRAG